MKTCRNCGESKPATAEFFYRHHGEVLRGECRSCTKKASADHAALDPDAKRATQKKRYWRDPEARRAATRKWQKENPEKALETDYRWRAANIDKYREIVRKGQRARRARIAGTPTNPYTEQQVLDVYGADCHICLEPVDLTATRRTGMIGWERGLHMDHVLAIANGGSDSLENVRPSHGACNIRKNANLMETAHQT